MVLVKKKGNFYRAVIKLLGILFLLFVGSRQHAPAFPNLPTWSGFPRLAGAPVGADLSAKPLPFVELRQHASAFSDLPVPMLASTLRKPLVLRRATPTRLGFSRSAGIFVGADLSAKPLSFAEPRQHALIFSNLPASLLASPFPQSLCPSSSHANTPQLFPVCRCPCWRRPSRKAFALRRFTPTHPGFFRFAGAYVGVDLPVKPLPFVESRQHAPAFPDLPAPMLAPTSPQSLCPSSSHANKPRLFPTCRHPCWRRPSRKAFALRRVTPTRPGFFQSAGANVGVALIAKPLPFVEPRQHAPAFPDLPTPMLVSPSSQSLCPSLSHANTQKYRTGNLCNTKREENGFTDSLSFFFYIIRSCRNYSAITVPTQALPVHAALPSSVSR